jgi:hypothetical protein
MSFTRFSRIGAAAAFATAISTTALAQTPTPQTPAEQPRVQQPRTQQSDMTVEGQLQSVDATEKEIVVKTTAGKEETLRYDDSTKVVGGQSGIAGLANSKGTDVVVKFRGSGDNRVATEITIREKKSS